MTDRLAQTERYSRSQIERAVVVALIENFSSHFRDGLEIPKSRAELIAHDVLAHLEREGQP